MFSQQSGLVDVREEAETISSTPSPSFSCMNRQCSAQLLWMHSRVCGRGWTYLPVVQNSLLEGGKV